MKGHGPSLLGAPVRTEELSSVEIISCLPAPALEDVCARARRRAFERGEVVFSEGDRGDSLFVVRSGLLHVVRPSVDPEMVLDRLAADQVFGELAAVNECRRSASVIAVEDSSAVEITKSSLDIVFDEHPAAARRMLGSLGAALTATKEQLTLSNDVLERRVEQRTQELRDAQLEVVRRLSQLAESRDSDMGLHITRMSRLAAELGRCAGLDAEESELLLHAAAMHDIGKIAIPESILMKPGKLSPAEWELMKTHTTIGANLLSGSRSPVVRMAEVIALTHQERWDGSGYPKGLAGEDIPLVGRICSVCDVFDALISERPYKHAWTVEETLAEIESGSGCHFDPFVVAIFLERFEEFRDLIDDRQAGNRAPDASNA
jgi:HD-GYP domain-containing protein (c-di-GMP phosphodiesterase class II)